MGLGGSSSTMLFTFLNFATVLDFVRDFCSLDSVDSSLVLLISLFLSPLEVLFVLSYLTNVLDLTRVFTGRLFMEFSEIFKSLLVFDFAKDFFCFFSEVLCSSFVEFLQLLVRLSLSEFKKGLLTSLSVLSVLDLEIVFLDPF